MTLLSALNDFGGIKDCLEWRPQVMGKPREQMTQSREGFLVGEGLTELIGFLGEPFSIEDSSAHVCKEDVMIQIIFVLSLLVRKKHRDENWNLRAPRGAVHDPAFAPRCRKESRPYLEILATQMDRRVCGVLEERPKGSK
jgi:hypothetical protein